MLKGKKRLEQLNNVGFSLLEVLIAIVILSIVSIPLLHAFVTVAKTNAKAKILLRATDAAENLMESFKYQKLIDLETKYAVNVDNTVTVDDDGKVVLTIRNTSDIPVKLPEKYYMIVTADPTLYPNANGLNLSDFKTVSAADSAVYTMSSQYDNGIYEMFEKWNKEAAEDSPLVYTDVDTDYFKSNLSRTIKVTIDKKGNGTNDEGDTVNLVAVHMNITYELKSNSGILPSSQKTYVTSESEMFNNQVTKVPLSSVYILYQPRYRAAIAGKGDKIIVENVDNITTNLFVVAQNGAADESYKSQYLSKMNGLKLNVIETPKSAGFPDKWEGAITLFTNLNSGAPYSVSTLNSGEMRCTLTYQNIAETLTAKDDKALAILGVRDVDGKALKTDQTKERIYKLITEVYDANGKKVVKLDGTKLE